ncbi:MAG: T9SS type A sorting domain-containing protein [Thermoplasmata archaeon]
MTGCLKTFSRVSLLLLLVLGISNIGPTDSIAAQILRYGMSSGGAMRLTSTNFMLSSSFGEPLTGVVDGETIKLYNGFWNPEVVEWATEPVIELPDEFALHQNYPNPFNAGTTIEYDLPVPSDVRIYIYNVLGQQVRVLVDEWQDAGYKASQWFGKNDRGYRVSTGVYFYRIVAADFQKTKKMMFLK